MTPKAIVKAAEAAHASMDVEQMLACFEDTIQAFWNGRQIASNKDELAQWYHAFFDHQRDFRLTKTLRVADGNRLAVEWEHQRTDGEGNRFEAFAAEIWVLSENHKLTEWHAYCSEYPVDAAA